MKNGDIVERRLWSVGRFSVRTIDHHPLAVSVLRVIIRSVTIQLSGAVSFINRLSIHRFPTNYLCVIWSIKDLTHLHFR